MSGIRRIVMLAATALVAIGLTVVTTGTTAAAAHHGPRPVSKWTEVVKAHEATWVSIYWITDRKICDVEVTVEGEDVVIGYPENTDPYTSFLNAAELLPGRADYTAFRVLPDYYRTTIVPLVARMTYNTCGNTAVEQSRTYWLRLPVLRNFDD